jgi:hypothetical protein
MGGGAWPRQRIPLLNANLKEEKAADKKLNAIAEGKVNIRATGHRTAAQRASSKKKRGSAKRSAAVTRTRGQAGAKRTSRKRK